MKWYLYILAIILGALLFCGGSKTESKHLINEDSIRIKTYDILHVINKVSLLARRNYLLSHDQKRIIFLDSTCLYTGHIETKDVDSIFLKDIIGFRFSNNYSYRLAYFSLDSLFCIIAFDKKIYVSKTSSDSIYFVILDRQLNFIEKRGVRLADGQMLEELAFDGVHNVVVFKGSLFLNCSMSPSFLITGLGQIEYLKNTNGDRFLFDPISKGTLSVRSFNFHEGEDYYLYRGDNLQDTVIVASRDSVLRNVRYLGNPLLLGNELLFRNGFFYDVKRGKWVDFKFNMLMRPTYTGSGFFTIEKGVLYIYGR